MSREIKFRAWNKKKKFMESAWLIDWEHGEVCHAYHNVSKLDDCVLMQFTGLYDSESKEVYEGDILTDIKNANVDENPYVVCFSDGAYYWKCLQSKAEDFLYQAITGNGKVIGNIYENPELL